MSYPTISRADARGYLTALKAEVGAVLPSVKIVEEGASPDWESIASDTMAKLAALAKGDPVKKRADPRGAAFEIAAGPILHQSLPQHEALGDPEFWTWLTLVHGSDIVKWRYESEPDFANFGAGGPGENLLFRIWLRAEVALSPGKNPYELVGVGDIDFWRSHIFRQSYADARTFARALLDFQFPADKGRKARLSIDEIRLFAKHLKRARTNLMFELMDAKRAREFIDTEWARLASPA